MTERLAHYEDIAAEVDVGAEAFRALDENIHKKPPTAVLSLLLNRQNESLDKAADVSLGVQPDPYRLIEFEALPAEHITGLIGVDDVRAVERVLEKLVELDLAISFVDDREQRRYSAWIAEDEAKFPPTATLQQPFGC